MLILYSYTHEISIVPMNTTKQSVLFVCDHLSSEGAWKG